MENKTEIYQLRLTQQEANAFAVWAEKMGGSRSKLLRKFIRQVINEEPDLLADEQYLFRQAVNQLASCGNNLNQMTAAVNAGKFKDSHLDRQIIQAAYIAVNELKATLNRYLRHTHLRWIKPEEP